MLRPRTFPLSPPDSYPVCRNLTKKSLISRDTWAWTASRWFNLLSGAFVFLFPSFHSFQTARAQEGTHYFSGVGFILSQAWNSDESPSDKWRVFACLWSQFAFLWKVVSALAKYFPNSWQSLFFNPCVLIGTEPIIVLRIEEFRCFAFDSNDWVCLRRSFQKKLAC